MLLLYSLTFYASQFVSCETAHYSYRSILYLYVYNPIKNMRIKLQLYYKFITIQGHPLISYKYIIADPY